MPFSGFRCQRCGECCRKLGSTVLSFTEYELRGLERDGIGSDLEAFRADARVDFNPDINVYEVLDKQTSLGLAGIEVTLEFEGEHCAFFTLDENGTPACGMELDYGIKPETCREFPTSPEKGVVFSDCPACRAVLGDERSDELRQEAAKSREPPSNGTCPF